MPHYEDAKQATEQMKVHEGYRLVRTYVTGDPIFDDAKIYVEGVGEVTVKGCLPQHIMAQIEDYYFTLLSESLKARAA